LNKFIKLNKRVLKKAIQGESIFKLNKRVLKKAIQGESIFKLYNIKRECQVKELYYKIIIMI